MERRSTMSKVRPLSQGIFFVVFIGLMFTGKAQFWMGFIFISILLSGFFGRYYCGWACPINTLIRPVSWISKKLGLQKKGIPDVLKTEKPRWILFSLFLIGLAYTIYTITQGGKFPLPLIIIPLGLLTTLFINENAWHRYLCPWGVLFSLTGRFAKLGLKVSSSNCTSCSLCQLNCPAEAIKVDKKKGAEVDSTYCLLCFKCENNCPTNAISYQKLSGGREIKDIPIAR